MARMDALGDRVKQWEARETGRRALKGLPLVARVDGRSFSRFTAGMTRPYDQDLADLMVETAKYLVDEVSGTRVAYTQSEVRPAIVSRLNIPAWIKAFFEMGRSDRLATVAMEG
jgi:tRNA(His) 5'-end guanylyltransferase